MNISAAEFSRQLMVLTNQIAQIKGQRSNTGDTALRLAHSSTQALNSG